MQHIAGVGTDLIRIDRIQRAFDKRGMRFVEKILGPQEIEKFKSRYAKSSKRGIAFLSTRFAAKEAFSKAIGLGMRWPMTWTRMQTLNEPSGRPIVVLHPELQTWYDQRFGLAHISLTDETDMAMAYVMIETLET